MKKLPLILCIDDNKTVIAFLVAILSRNGYRTITACDGLEGLDKMRKFKPNIAIVDINMPKLTGFDVALIASEEKELKDIPIIILSALTQAHNKEDVKFKNIYHYLTKPVNTAELLSTIRRALNHISNINHV